MDILNVIALIVCIVTGVVAGWVWGYGAGYRKAARDEYKKSRDLGALKPGEAYCIHCFATMPEHYHGCPIAAEFKLVTIAKIEDTCTECGAPVSNHCPGRPRNLEMKPVG